MYIFLKRRRKKFVLIIEKNIRIILFISSPFQYFYKKKRVNDEYSRQEFLNKSINWLGYITGRHVLYNAKLTKDTANLLSNLCEKPSTLHLISKSLRGLFEIKIIFNGKTYIEKIIINLNNKIVTNKEAKLLK